MRRFRIIVIALGFGALGSLLVAAPAAAQLKKGSRFDKGTRCLQCHEGVGQNVSVPHAPLASGDCASCHKPHGLVGALRLVKKEPELCLDCHDRGQLGLDASHRHPEVEKCSTCHDPHGSNQPAMLSKPERELCTSCHQDADFDGNVPHAPGRRRRALRATGHTAATQPALLIAPRDALCGSCHDGRTASPLSTTASRWRAPTAPRCHQPHSAAGRAPAVRVGPSRSSTAPPATRGPAAGQPPARRRASASSATSSGRAPGRRWLGAPAGRGRLLPRLPRPAHLGDGAAPHRPDDAAVHHLPQRRGRPAGGHPTPPGRDRGLHELPRRPPVRPPHLLAAEPRELCVTCHDDPRRVGRGGDPLPGAPRTAPPATTRTAPAARGAASRARTSCAASATATSAPAPGCRWSTPRWRAARARAATCRTPAPAKLLRAQGVDCAAPATSRCSRWPRACPSTRRSRTATAPPATRRTPPRWRGCW